MFSDLNLRRLKALDLGFGLGGVAFYLAEKYKLKIVGIEIHPWMVHHANKHISAHLSDSLEFNTYTNSSEPSFYNGSFEYELLVDTLEQADKNRIP